MSANNRSQTKIPEDENTDSGFLSGPCDILLDSGEVSEPLESEKPKEVRDSISDQKTELDSGIIIAELAQELESVEIKSGRVAPSDLPPFVILFQQDDDGDTQLHIASVHGCAYSVGRLIKECPNKELLDVRNYEGHTALHLAVMSGNAVVTRMLVIAGLSLGVRDRKGETPLHKASAMGHVECLQALLSSVPEHPQRTLTSILNQKNYNGQACIHLAASAGYLEVLQILIHYGADINSRENLAGWTALHIAARRGDARAALWLRERSCGARDYAGRSARRLARSTRAARVFLDATDDSDSDPDDEDDYDSDSESLFARISVSANLINVA